MKSILVRFLAAAAVHAVVLIAICLGIVQVMRALQTVGGNALAVPVGAVLVVAGILAIEWPLRDRLYGWAELGREAGHAAKPRPLRRAGLVGALPRRAVHAEPREAVVRDPARIDDVLAKLRAAWCRYPDQRLGQLVVNLFQGRPAYQPEDDVLLERLNLLLEHGWQGVAAAAQAERIEHPNLRTQLLAAEIAAMGPFSAAELEVPNSAELDVAFAIRIAAINGTLPAPIDLPPEPDDDPMAAHLIAEYERERGGAR